MCRHSIPYSMPHFAKPPVLAHRSKSLTIAPCESIADTTLNKAFIQTDQLFSYFYILLLISNYYEFSEKCVE